VAEIEPANHFFLNEEAEHSGRSWTFPIHFTWTVPLLFYLFPYFRPRKLSVPFFFFSFFKKIQKHNFHRFGPEMVQNIQRPISGPKKIVLGGHVTIKIFWLMNTKRIWLGWPAHARCVYDRWILLSFVFHLIKKNGK